MHASEPWGGARAVTLSTPPPPPPPPPPDTQLRAALTRENTERRRAARDRLTLERRARRQAGASKSLWNELPVHRAPNPAPITLGAIKVCPHCRAELLYDEDSSFCCRRGKVAVELLPSLPPGWVEMLQDPIFRKHSRKYNDLFAFSAIGVEGREGFVHEAAPSCVKIHG